MAKTEASCIRNESLAPHFRQQTIDIMKTDFFSLSTDGSNDTGLEKKNSLTVRLFDINTIMIDTQFLDISAATQVKIPEQQLQSFKKLTILSTIFHKIDDVMTKLQLPWSDCVGFSLDNTSADLGVRNSVMTRVILKNENCYCYITQQG